jgi:hypothetical protein
VKKPGFFYMLKMRKLVGGIFAFFFFKAEKEHRKAFFKLVNTTGRYKRWFMPKSFFIYTNYLMDFKRAQYDAQKARQRAQWENAHPEEIVPEASIIPIPEAIRKKAKEISATAWNVLADKVPTIEALYRVTIEAVIDYSDRFGATLETFDEHQKSYFTEACHRAIAALTLSEEGSGALVDKKIPADFAREIMDAVDKEVRVRVL